MFIAWVVLAVCLLYCVLALYLLGWKKEDLERNHVWGTVAGTVLIAATLGSFAVEFLFKNA